MNQTTIGSFNYVEAARAKPYAGAAVCCRNPDRDLNCRKTRIRQVVACALSQRIQGQTSDYNPNTPHLVRRAR